MSTRDYRDLAIDILADSEAALLECIASLEVDNRVLREMLSVALEQLHQLTYQLQGHQSRIHLLLDGFRGARDEARRLRGRLREREHAA